MSPSASRSLPTTIDEAVARLDGIIEDAITAESRLGYFAALYNRVTKAVRDGIRKGVFDDNARMERLDVVFANRYIAAYDTYRRGEMPTASWFVAFRAAERPKLSVLRHLILGMNAHINLDLGIASATVAGRNELDALHADFNRINDLLGTLLPVVEAQLGEISPRLGAVTDLARSADNLDATVGNFSMVKARDGAWRFARRLSLLDADTAWKVAISARDTAIAVLGTELVEHAVTSVLISGSARNGIAGHIRILARDEPVTVNDLIARI
jgi:hypothetical protein